MWNFFGMLSDSVPTVYNNLSHPALRLVEDCPSFRICPELPDLAWVAMGIQRALHESATGRAFLQTHGFDWAGCPDFSHYFQALKSPRRLRLLQDLNGLLARRLTAGLPDELAMSSRLENFDLYAWDGHWHKTASQDLVQRFIKPYPALHPREPEPFNHHQPGSPAGGDGGQILGVDLGHQRELRKHFRKHREPVSDAALGRHVGRHRADLRL